MAIFDRVDESLRMTSSVAVPPAFPPASASLSLIGFDFVAGTDILFSFRLVWEIRVKLQSALRAGDIFKPKQFSEVAWKPPTMILPQSECANHRGERNGKKRREKANVHCRDLNGTALIRANRKGER
jgi:hypothetical protein